MRSPSVSTMSNPATGAVTLREPFKLSNGTLLSNRIAKAALSECLAGDDHGGRLGVDREPWQLGHLGTRRRAITLRATATVAFTPIAR